jgi:hypothetical protein
MLANVHAASVNKRLGAVPISPCIVPKHRPEKETTTMPTLSSQSPRHLGQASIRAALPAFVILLAGWLLPAAAWAGSSEALQLTDVSCPTTGLCVAVDEAGQVLHPSRAASPIVLTGPRSDLQLGRAYGYDLTVTARWPYRHVRVIVSAPAAHYRHVFAVNLLSGKTLRLNTFTLRYTTAAQLDRGITVAVELPTHHDRAGRLILHTHYALALGSASNGPSGNPSPPPPVMEPNGSVMSPITNSAGQLICPPEQAPGIYLCGDSTVSLDTEYTYELEVVSSQSYNNAVIWFETPVYDSAQRREVDLTANQPWNGSFETEFGTTTTLATPLISTEGISVTVVSPATKKPPYAHGIYTRNFPLTLATGA